MNAEYCCIRFYFQKPGLWDQSGTENDKMVIEMLLALVITEDPILDDRCGRSSLSSMLLVLSLF